MPSVISTQSAVLILDIIRDTAIPISAIPYMRRHLDKKLGIQSNEPGTDQSIDLNVSCANNYNDHQCNGSCGNV